MRRKNSSHQRASGQLRIIGGQWRGRKLSFPDIEGLRPTGNRIRETLFNWLAEKTPGSQCLDLFAGSGALGWEALSRGAQHCVFCERDPRALDHLRRNDRALQSGRATITGGDALTLLQRPNDRAYDLVFLDPPFRDANWQACIEHLERGGWLRADAWLYLETPCATAIALPPQWTIRRQQSSGSVHYQLWQKTPGSGV